MCGHHAGLKGHLQPDAGSPAATRTHRTWDMSSPGVSDFFVNSYLWGSEVILHQTHSHHKLYGRLVISVVPIEK